jgi:hypothetical protein
MLYKLNQRVMYMIPGMELPEEGIISEHIEDTNKYKIENCQDNSYIWIGGNQIIGHSEGFRG